MPVITGTGGSGAEGHPWLHRKFKTSLSYKRPCLKFKKKKDWGSRNKKDKKVARHRGWFLRAHDGPAQAPGRELKHKGCSETVRELIKEMCSEEVCSCVLRICISIVPHIHMFSNGQSHSTVWEPRTRTMRPECENQETWSTQDRISLPLYFSFFFK